MIPQFFVPLHRRWPTDYPFRDWPGVNVALIGVTWMAVCIAAGVLVGALFVRFG